MSLQRAIIFSILVYCCLNGLVLSQTIKRSYWDERTAKFSSSFTVSSSTTGKNFEVSFYIWIIPIMSNSVVHSQQIARISRSEILTTSNQSTSQLLLLTANDHSIGVSSCVFQIISSSSGCSESSTSFSSLGLSSQGQWVPISITLKSKKNLILTINSQSYSYTSTSLVTDKKLYLYFGYEYFLTNLQQFNGFYYYYLGFLFSSISKTPAPSSTSVYSQTGRLTTLFSKSTQLGGQSITSLNTEDNLIFPAYQFSTTVALTAPFILPKQLLRITTDASIFDSRILGYCLLCLTAYQNNFILTTFTFNYQDGLSEISIPLSSTSLNQNQAYTILVDYQQQTQTLSVFLDGIQVASQTNIIHPGVSTVDVVYLGDFHSDSYFSGSMRNLQVNYGKIATISANPASFEKCDDLCQICDATTKNCLFCQVSSTDLYRDSSAKCACKPGYYFDASQKCTPCHKSCSSCYGIEATQCLTCPVTRNFDSASNTCVCAPYYYDDGVSQSCQSCYPDCLSCLGPSINQCTSCGIGMSINDLGQCICEKGYYLHSSSCLKCLPECDSCLNGTSCQSCRVNYALSSAKRCECNHGYYKVDEFDSSSSSSTSTCSRCTENCYTCIGSEEGDCIKCDLGYKLNNIKTCERSLFVEVDSVTQQMTWMNNWGQIALQWSVVGIVFVDFLLNIYANTFSFSRIFRSQQFILKIFYLKLIYADYTQINYQLISALSYFNGITNIFYYMNPFKQTVVQSSTQIGNKIYLERIPSSILECSGGVILIFVIFFCIAFILSLYVGCSHKNNQKQLGRQNEINNRDSQSNSIISSVGIEIPLNPAPNDTSDADIHGLKFVGNNLMPNNNNKNNQPFNNLNTNTENYNHSQNLPQNLTNLEKFNRIYQHGFWHFHEYAINVVCFACSLHLVGSSQQPDEIKPQNFICYVLLGYIVLICLICRSFGICIPKMKKDYSIYRQLAVENEKLIQSRKDKLAPQKFCKGIKTNGDKKKDLNRQVQHQEESNQIPNINKVDEGYDAEDSEDSRSSSSNSNSEDSSKNERRNSEQVQNIIISSCSSGKQRKKEIVKMLETKWKPFLSESIALKGLFECLHMEFISGFKGCKFYFWFYVANYFCLSASIASAHSSAAGQYSLLLFFSVLGVLTSLIRPYQDILESIKNILDNVLFLFALFLQSIMSSSFSPISENYTITQELDEKLNVYAYASAAMMLLAILSFPCLTVAQIIKRRKASKEKEQETQGDSFKNNQQNEQKKDDDNGKNKHKNINIQKKSQKITNNLNDQMIEMANQKKEDNEDSINNAEKANSSSIDDSKHHSQSTLEDKTKLNKIQNINIELMKADLYGNQKEIINKHNFASFDKNTKLTKDLDKQRSTFIESNQAQSYLSNPNPKDTQQTTQTPPLNLVAPLLIYKNQPSNILNQFMRKPSQLSQSKDTSDLFDYSQSLELTARLPVFDEELFDNSMNDNN